MQECQALGSSGAAFPEPATKIWVKNGAGRDQFRIRDNGFPGGFFICYITTPVLVSFIHQVTTKNIDYMLVKITETKLNHIKYSTPNHTEKNKMNAELFQHAEVKHSKGETDIMSSFENSTFV